MAEAASPVIESTLPTHNGAHLAISSYGNNFVHIVEAR